MNRRLLLIVVASFAALVIGFPMIVGWAADWFWFQAVGFQNVFLKEFRTELGLGIGIGVLAFAFLYSNLRFALRGATLPVMVGVRGQPETRIDLTRMVRRLVWPASIVLAAVLGLSATGAWLTVLCFLHA